VTHHHPSHCQSIVATLLAVFTAAAPVVRASAASARPMVVLLPFVPLTPLADEMAPRATELLAAELKARDEVRLVPALPERSGAGRSHAQADAAEAQAAARTGLARAAEQARSGRHGQAAETARRALAQLTARPLALDEAGSELIESGEVLLAVERLLAGDEDGSDAALAALVRLAPGRSLSAADYPPAFLRAHEAVRKRLLAAPRGALRIGAPAGPGAARVLLDGKRLRAAPVLLTNALPGEHFVRVERGGEAWAERIVVIAGVESKVAPQLGQVDSIGELSAALSLGVLDRATAGRAAKIAKAASAQAAVVGVVMKEAEVISLRSFLVRGERVVALPPVSLDREMLGAPLAMLKLADEVQQDLTGTSPAPASLPITLGPQVGEEASALAEFSVAPPPPGWAAQKAPEPGAPEQADRAPAKAAAAPDPQPAPAQTPPPAATSPAEPGQRRVAMPGEKPNKGPAGAAATPAPETAAPATGTPTPAPETAARKPAVPEQSEPSRSLVIPRKRSGEADAADAPAQVTSERVKIASPPPQQRLEALEPESIKSVREPEQNKNHALLWILAGVLVAGGLAGGLYVYENGRTPSTASVSATWAH